MSESALTASRFEPTHVTPPYNKRRLDNSLSASYSSRSRFSALI